MRTRPAIGWHGGVAVIAALATAPGGCAVRLADGVSRSSGFVHATNVPRSSAGSRDDVPVHGHHVRVSYLRAGAVTDEQIAGELIAAGDTEVVIERSPRERVRIPVADVKSISIELAPSQVGPTLALSLGAMALGLAGLMVANDENAPNAFAGGWGLVWLPLGLFVALPTAIVLAATGDAGLQSRPSTLDSMMRNLYQFARYPQGEPARPSKPAPVIGPPPAPPVTPPAAAPPTPPTAPAGAAPPAIETFPSVAPPPGAPPAPPAPPKPKPAPVPAPEEKEDSSEPSVVPYSPGRPQTPPTR
jgi:hypothetical protein